MADRRGTVYLHENEVTGILSEGDWWFEGTFSASRQDHLGRSVIEEAELDSLAEAISWTTARVSKAYIDVGGCERMWIGAGSPPGDIADGRAWLASGPELRRRRHPSFAFMDRAPTDSPISWSISAWIGQAAGAGETESPRHAELEMDAEVARFAQRVGGQWDRRSRDLFLRDLRAAERRARGEDFGWMTYHRSEHRIRMTVSAATHGEALALARRALGDPDGLDVVELRAVPVGWSAPYSGDEEAER